MRVQIGGVCVCFPWRRCASFNLMVGEITRRWPGQQVPVVRFVTGREVFMLPEVFEADVHTAGTCRRIQVCGSKTEKHMRVA